MQPILRIQNLHHTFQPEGSTPIQALRGVDLTIHKGEYIVILGHNGSGKSTLAKHLNGLLLPAQGDVWVKEWNTKDKTRLRDIRTTVGMVFQQPDNQIVATIVEEDIAFGPENLGLARDEIMRRVDWSLEQVEMQAYRHRAPHTLSGGQKQRICIAGAIAMQPAVLVLDEATAMLDPLGRKEVLSVARRLNREQGVTIIAITHFMHEAIEADRVCVMSEGQIVLQGTPRQVFQHADRLRHLHLDLPPIARLAHELSQRIAGFPSDLLTIEEMVAAVKQGDRETRRQGETLPLSPSPPLLVSLSSPLISVRNLTHFYMRGTPLEVKALEDVNMEVRAGEVVGILGHTGSGKSTVVQHFNALLRPHGGKVEVFGKDVAEATASEIRQIRRQVGLVFQFAEAQLFEQYVGDDIAFGPRNLGLNREEVRERVRVAMEAVGLDFEGFKDRVTFRLSGGQMRRVALAGVLALNPQVLVLDEPTAGLDPHGRRQLLEQILALRQRHITLVMISHNMDELAAICDRLYVIAEGSTVMNGTPSEIFGQSDRLHELGLDVPEMTALVDALVAKGVLPPGKTVYTLEQAVERIISR